MVYKVPDNVIDKKLYLYIKNNIENTLKKDGRRWSLYASGRLVQEYKQRGGRYIGTKNNNGLNRWFKEEWIDTCKLPKKVQCGRQIVSKNYNDMKKTFPYCRPTYKVDKSTPKTWKEMSKSDIEKHCKRKKKL